MSGWITFQSAKLARVDQFSVGVDMFEQFWQPFLNCVPDNIEVNVKIAMSHAVPHIPHAAPRYFAVCLGKRGIMYRIFSYNQLK